MKYKRADNIDDAYDACHPEEPLAPDDPRYVDLTGVRGNQDLVRIIARRIRRTRPPRYHQQLITGHRGCGKSTELLQLTARLREQKFFAVYVDIENVLDPGDLNYIDVLVALAKAVAEQLEQQKITISPKLLKNLDGWFADRLLTEEEKTDVEATLKSEFAVEPKVPLLVRMLTAVSGQMRSGSSRKLEIRRNLERELQVLLQRMNDLIDDAQVRLQKNGWNSLVAIVDGLEKMHYQILPDGQSSHSALFVEHAEQLKAPHCHVIYTVPISLLFNVNLGDSFVDTEIIPMVKIGRRSENKTYSLGIEALIKVLEMRVDIDSIFESRKLVQLLIQISGGSMRDLMRLLRFTFDETDTKVTHAHVESAVQKLARQYDRLIKETDLELLKKIAEEKQVPGDEASGRLLHHRLVLEYFDTERWADVHPAVRLSRRVQTFLDS